MHADIPVESATAGPLMQRAAGERPRATRIAIVIPAFQHGGLVSEAVFSVISQHEFGDVDIILVDDGCQDPQTYATLSQFALAWPNVHYVRHVNAGLSAARNRGIQFVIDRLSATEAIFFLDADNMLADYALRSMQRALEDNPRADWFYPDIRMFGMRYFFNYSGPFRRVVAALVNICEAGSLIRRRVFTSGLRFDEQMKLGYEDWEFWLSAIEKGYRGQHIANSGFCYRKRAQSMLSESALNDENIKAYISNKHRSLYQINAFNNLEHNDLPRFAIVRPDRADVMMVSDPMIAGSTIGIDQFETKFWLSVREPNFEYVGNFIIVTNSSTLTVLSDARLLRMLTAMIEAKLQTKNFVALQLSHSTVDELDIQWPDSLSEFHLIAFSRDLLRAIARDESSKWIDEFPIKYQNYDVACCVVAIPSEQVDALKLKATAAGDLIHFFLHLRAHHLRTAPNFSASEINYGIPDLSTITALARQRFGGGLLPPIATPQKGRIAFVLPICDFGGVEKATFCLALALKGLGFTPSLIVLGKSRIARFAEAREIFEDIHVFVDYMADNWGGPSFLGTNLSPIRREFRHQDMVNFLGSFEVVVSAHSAEILELMRPLQKAGVTTASYIHLFDRTSFGRFVGHPMLALAYEHSLDMVLTCSNLLADEVAGLGIPRHKLVRVPNASTIAISGRRRSEIARLRDGAAEEEIRLLFIGRLDRQKGLDRLAKIVSATADTPGVSIRIIGKSIVEETTADLDYLAEFVEEPIYETDLLSDAYTWADVLLLPSLYEGLPLTVIEAMAHGVVPIVADCGAVGEAIDDGVNGFIVPQAQVVIDFTAHILKLRDDRTLRREMQLAAMEKGSARDWREGAQALFGKIEQVREERLRRQTRRTSDSN
jgi:glycosyltransferase involved in cell wall biosynthesis